MLKGHYMLAYDSAMAYPVAKMHDLWILNPDTGDNQMLWDGGGDETHPSFSSEGAFVVYSSSDWSSSTDLYIYGLLSGVATQLTFDSDGNDSPHGAGDGECLFVSFIAVNCCSCLADCQ